MLSATAGSEYRCQNFGSMEECDINTIINLETIDADLTEMETPDR